MNVKQSPPEIQVRNKKVEVLTEVHCKLQKENHQNTNRIVHNITPVQITCQSRIPGCNPLVTLAIFLWNRKLSPKTLEEKKAQMYCSFSYTSQRFFFCSFSVAFHNWLDLYESLVFFWRYCNFQGCSAYAVKTNTNVYRNFTLEWYRNWFGVISLGILTQYCTWCKNSEE